MWVQKLNYGDICPFDYTPMEGMYPITLVQRPIWFDKNIEKWEENRHISNERCEGTCMQ